MPLSVTPTSPLTTYYISGGILLLHVLKLDLSSDSSYCSSPYWAHSALITRQLHVFPGRRFLHSASPAEKASPIATHFHSLMWQESWQSTFLTKPKEAAGAYFEGPHPVDNEAASASGLLGCHWLALPAFSKKNTMPATLPGSSQTDSTDVKKCFLTWFTLSSLGSVTRSIPYSRTSSMPGCYEQETSKALPLICFKVCWTHWRMRRFSKPEGWHSLLPLWLYSVHGMNASDWRAGSTSQQSPVRLWAAQLGLTLLCMTPSLGMLPSPHGCCSWTSLPCSFENHHSEGGADAGLCFAPQSGCGWESSGMFPLSVHITSLQASFPGPSLSQLIPQPRGPFSPFSSVPCGEAMGCTPRLMPTADPQQGRDLSQGL